MTSKLAELLEPTVPSLEGLTVGDHIQLSIAISLRRIADKQCGDIDKFVEVLQVRIQQERTAMLHYKNLLYKKEHP